MGGRRIIESFHPMTDTSKDYQDEDNDIIHDDADDDQYDNQTDEMINEERKGEEPNRVSPVNNSEDDIKPPAAPVLIPSLRGKYELVGSNVVCKGLWAMSDAGHAFPDQTSPFEFKLSKSFDALSSALPISGKYQGWFFLKQAPPFKGLKIDDKDMIIKFMKNESDHSYKVEGRGVNRFGSFNLYGTLFEDNTVQLYREYIPKSLPGAKVKASAETKNKVSTADSDIHREGSGRVRKVSAFMKEYEDSLAPKPAKAAQPKAAVPANASPVSTISGGRSQRTPAAIVKCSELLKEIMKLPLAVYFLEPVDPIKLNIPDYVTIITKPMDFGTISKNIERNTYESPEQFAEHMRLVFRNAITYNQMRDHPVHIAARELSAKFEDRFRSLMATLAAIPTAPSAYYYNEPKLARQASSSSTKSKIKSRSSTSWAKGRPSSVGSNSRFDAFMPPVMDASAASLIEMQRKMQEMQEELVALRTTIRQTEVKSSLETQRTAAQNPLTFEEKRSLIAQIHRLPGEKMDHVIEIIQAAMKPNQRGDNDEIEIPLDELDTLTLRKLQRYVEDCNRPKKRQSAPAPATNRNGSTSKKPRVDYPSTYSETFVPPTAVDQTLAASHYAMDDEELLFDTNVLEEEGIHSQVSPIKPVASSSQSGIDDDIAALLNKAASTLEGGITIVNASAWANTNSIVENSLTTATANKGSEWSAMAAEVIAKEEREQHRREEQERLIAARAKQEADRIENLRRQNEILEQQQRLEQKQQNMMKQMAEEREAKELQLRKEEERKRREEEAAAALSASDLQRMMTYMDDDDDDIAA